ncbi:MAG: hypothetical protein KBG67_04445 [Candidatus Atribacteria bacterium]|nr:hypothetical protein [Candidatus Atribacteria bacterium]
MKDRSKLISGAGEVYYRLDGSIRKRVAKKIDELSENLYLGKLLEILLASILQEE